MKRAKSNATPVVRDIGSPEGESFFRPYSSLAIGLYILFFPLFLAILIPISNASGAPLLLSTSNQNETVTQTFPAHGVVQEVKSDGEVLVIKHDAIAGCMDAMTMPFRVKEPVVENGWLRGDEISFQLHVSETESWIDHITKIGTVALPPLVAEEAVPAPKVHARHPLLDCTFTNELGQPVTLGGFHGQALAITFFFTRCPLPEFCPRLTKNFEAASEKLAAMSGAPTNWHFISVSFDPEADTPAVLKAYAEAYHYNPAHWSFLTGPPDKIRELASVSGVQLQRTGSLINHNFRTQIVDANGHLQNTFPFGGDISDMIVTEILKAATVTNQTLLSKP